MKNSSNLLNSLPSWKRFKMKWWGWGQENIRLKLDDKPGIWPYLQKNFGLERLLQKKSFNLDLIQLQPPQISPEIIAEFKLALSHGDVFTSNSERIIHAFGKSYYDLIRIRQGKIDSPPDIILYPTNEDEIKSCIDLCLKYNLALVPFGGGTSVVGGVEGLKESKSGVATLNTTRLNKIISVDKEALSAHIQAGIFGPELEEKLNELGYTFGHFPQSFEFSTLGGWIAARSSGQNSLMYGGIEKLVISLKIITPTGSIQTIDVPRGALGPDVKEMLIGTEGSFGIIYSANVRLHRLPAEKKYFLTAFPSFAQAKKVVQLLSQSKISLAMVRVSDEEEMMGMLAMGKSKKGPIKTLISYLVKNLLVFKKINPYSFCGVMLGLEGSQSENKHNYKLVKRILKSHGGLILGTTPGKNWLKDRFALPYLRDEFLDNKMFIDTLETSTHWSNLLNLYTNVKKSIENSCPKHLKKYLVYCHISHLYPDGASLYFTILGVQDQGREIEQWKEMKDQASLAIIKSNGAISHHHGIGRDHKKYQYRSPQELSLVKTLKQKIDPQEIMNPGKLT